MLNPSRNIWRDAKEKADNSGSSGVSSLDTFKEECGRDEAYESWTGAVSASTPNSSTTALTNAVANMFTSQFRQRRSVEVLAVDASPAVPVGREENGKLVYSRKVFVGGLPPDIDAERIHASFRPYGVLQVGWPHKNESVAACPPKGFCFLQFQEEESVHRLVNACLLDGTGYYTLVSSPTTANKPVQIRPWVLADTETILDAERLDPRKAVFVGGVPRPLKSSQLAELMSRLYGAVAYAAIDTDSELGYPKGSARVVFHNRSSVIAAISARFVQIDLEDINKRVEVKPFILQDQICDVCRGHKCDGQLAPYFCGNVACLLYLCNDCWAKVHVLPGRQFHKPLLQKCNFHHPERARSHPQSWH